MVLFTGYFLEILAPLSWEEGTRKWFFDYQEAFPTELMKDSLLFFPIKEFQLVYFDNKSRALLILTLFKTSSFGV